MKLLTTILILLAFTGCSKKSAYTLTGTFSGKQNEEWIYLSKYEEGISFMDSTKIENGTFVFKGEIGIPEVYCVHYKPDKIIGVVPIFLEPGNLKLSIDMDNWEVNSKVTGGLVNDEYQSFEEYRIKKYYEPYMQLSAKLKNSKPGFHEALKDSINKINKEEFEYQNNYIKENYASPISLFVLSMLGYSLKTDEIGEHLKRFHPKLHNTSIYKNEKAAYELQLKLREGSKIGEFNCEFINLASDKRDLSLQEMLKKDNPNKILYVDVWSTWCGPCLNQMPFSKELYNKVDSSQVAFVYICINSTEGDWKKVIKDNAISGKHYLLGREKLEEFTKCNNISLYGVPHYILIGKNGAIINKNAPCPSSQGCLETINSFIK